MPTDRAAPSGERTGKRKDVHERALGLLAVRQRSRKELERRLVRAGFEIEDVEVELARLERVGLIDDEAFARSVVEGRMGSRGESTRVVAMHLARAGVRADVARGALAGVPETDEDRARRLAATKAQRMRELDPEVAFQRLYGFLARRGYAPDVARRTARKVLDLDVTDD